MKDSKSSTTTQSHSQVPTICPPGFPTRYTVVSGDTMWRIAQRYGISLESLIAANPHITNPNVINPGDVLCVPGPVPAPPPPRVPAFCPPGFGMRYTVVSGDTMWLIAQSYGISVEVLAAANPHIEDPAVIFPGDVLCVPEPAIPPPPVIPPRIPAYCPPCFRGRYTVRHGDTFWSIARNYCIDPRRLIKANPHIEDPNVLYPGDVLCVPTPRRPYY